jgi:hypothetical protein
VLPVTMFSWRWSSATSALGEPAVSVDAGIVVVVTAAATRTTSGSSCTASVDVAALVAVAVNLSAEVELVFVAVFVSIAPAVVVVVGVAFEVSVAAPTDASSPLVSTRPTPAVTETKAAIAVLHTNRRRFSGRVAMLTYCTVRRGVCLSRWSFS